MENDAQHKNRIPITSPEKFKYTYLALAFVCLIIILSISIYVIKNQADNDLLSYIENTSEQIVDAICYTEVDAITINTNLKVNVIEFDYLDTKIRDTYDALGVLSVTIYDSNNKVLYSTNKKIVDTTDNDKHILQSIINGQKESYYTTKQSVVDLYGEKRIDIDVLNVYVPVKNSDGKAIGTFLIQSDTTTHKSFYKHQLYSSIIILVEESI